MNKGVEGVAQDMTKAYKFDWSSPLDLGVGNRVYEEVNRGHRDKQQSVGKRAASTDGYKQSRQSNQPTRARVVTSGGIQIERGSSSAKSGRHSGSRKNQIDRKNQEIREHNEEVRRRRNEEIERHNQEVREHNERIERERRAREAARRQRLYEEGYNASMIASAGHYNHLHGQVDKMAANREMIKNMHNIDGFSRQSGYIASSSGATMSASKRSKAGIAPKRSQNKKNGEHNFIPITQRFPETDYYKFEIIDIKTEPVKWSIPKDTKKAFESLRDRCSEDQFVILKHEVIKLNKDQEPNFVGINDKGNYVFIGNDNIYSITPNADRIFFMSLKEESGNLLIEDNRSVDMKAEIGMPGKKSTEIEYSFGSSSDGNLTTKEEKGNIATIGAKRDLVKDKAQLSNMFPKLDIEAKAKLLNNWAESSANYILVTKHGAVEVNGMLGGGVKIDASAKFKTPDLTGINNEKTDNSSIIDYDINMKTVTAGLGIATKPVIKFRGKRYMVTVAINGEAGHGLSASKASKKPTSSLKKAVGLYASAYGLYAKGNATLSIDCIDNDDIIFPIKNKR